MSAAGAAGEGVRSGIGALRAAQEDFQSYLLGQPNDLENRMTGGPRADLASLLGIYRHAYRARLVEALRNDFAGLQGLVGEPDFEGLGAAYLARHPSRSWTTRRFGAALERFLKSTAPYAARPELSEMAAFEWALAEAFDAADAQALKHDAMAAVPPQCWADLRFILGPSARRLDLLSNVPEIWAALQAAKENESESAAHPRPSLGSPRAWLVWRAELDVKYRRLEPQEARAFDLMAEGASFGAICQALCAYIDEAEAAVTAASFLHGWIGLGLIVGLDFDAPFST